MKNTEDWIHICGSLKYLQIATVPFIQQPEIKIHFFEEDMGAYELL